MVKIPDRPESRLVFNSGDLVDFDESLLSDDSWEIELDAKEYGLEETRCASRCAI